MIPRHTSEHRWGPVQFRQCSPSRWLQTHRIISWDDDNDYEYDDHDADDHDHDHDDHHDDEYDDDDDQWFNGSNGPNGSTVLPRPNPVPEPVYYSEPFFSSAFSASWVPPRMV